MRAVIFVLSLVLIPFCCPFSVHADDVSELSSDSSDDDCIEIEFSPDFFTPAMERCILICRIMAMGSAHSIDFLGCVNDCHVSLYQGDECEEEDASDKPIVLSF